MSDLRCMLLGLWDKHYFDAKPKEPLGPGLHDIDCYPYRSYSRELLLYHLSLLLELDIASNYKQNFVVWTQAPKGLILNGGNFSAGPSLELSEANLNDLINIVQGAESPDVMVSSINGKFKLKDRACAEAILALILQIYNRDINHLAIRGTKDPPTRRWLELFAKLFNIKSVSAPIYPAVLSVHQLDLVPKLDKIKKLKVLFNTNSNHGTEVKPIVVDSPRQILHAEDDLNVDQFFKAKHKVSLAPTHAPNELTLYYLLVGTNDQVFPADPAYFSSLQVVSNGDYELHPIPTSLSTPKKNLRERLSSLFDKHRERKQKRKLQRVA